MGVRVPLVVFFFCLSLFFFVFFLCWFVVCCALVRCFLLHTHCLHWAGSSQSMPEPACGAALLCMTPALALAATTSAVRCWTVFNRQRDLQQRCYCTAMAAANHCAAIVADVRALGAAAGSGSVVSEVAPSSTTTRSASSSPLTHHP